MSDEIKTVRVKPWSESQGDFVVINESDFDASVHEMYEEAPQDAAEKPRRGRPPKQDAVEA
jgi:hypothetical protein